MAVDVKVPELGESISEVEVGAWLKQPGDRVEEDEPLVELESDKATVEVPAPRAGVLKEIVAEEGSVLKVGDVLAKIGEGDGDGGDEEEDEGKEAKKEKKKEKKEKKDDDEEKEKEKDDGKRKRKSAEEDDGGDEDESDEDEADKDQDEDEDEDTDDDQDGGDRRIMPAARRVMEEHGLSGHDVRGTGPGGRVTKEDALEAADGRRKAARDDGERKKQESSGKRAADEPTPAPSRPSGERNERTKRMSPIRRRIAERLVHSQQNAALLTTFNEIDMSRVKQLRAENQEAFTERYGVKLGFMSFFVKAAVEALREVPEINAQIRDEEIVYHDYCDIGIAVGGGKGLVVPVIRNAEVMEFGELEQTILDFAERAQANKIDLDELQGGTFTISNGGVYGSLLSTPIINPPQSGVLGLHAIQDRPVAIDGQVEIRPMMYVALTYDHRIVDGREAVTFLKHIKHCVERPERLLLKV